MLSVRHNMNTLRLSTALLILGLTVAVPSIARAQIEIGVQSEPTVSLSEQPDASVKLKNGQYRSGKFIYASRYYVVVEPKQAVRPDAMKMYGGLAIKWDQIDTFRITSLDVEIDPSGTTGEAIFAALSGLPGASGGTKEPTTVFKEARKEERKKPRTPKDEEPKVDPAEMVRPMNNGPKPEATPSETPLPGAATIPAAPATTAGQEAPAANPPMPTETPIPVVAAEAVFVCSSCGKDVRESQAKLGKCPHCGVAFGNVAAATGATPPPPPAPAGPRVLEIPQTDLSAQPQDTGFSFSNMSLGGQIGIFAGIIGVLFIVMRMM